MTSRRSASVCAVAVAAIAVFLAGYAPYAISFGAGQAMFALLVVELFNLMVPEGWEVGVVRLEAVAVGAAVALVDLDHHVAEGGIAALREEVAAHVRAGQRLVEAAFEGLIGRADADRDRSRAHRRAGGAASCRRGVRRLYRRARDQARPAGYVGAAVRAFRS